MAKSINEAEFQNLCRKVAAEAATILDNMEMDAEGTLMRALFLELIRQLGIKIREVRTVIAPFPDKATFYSYLYAIQEVLEDHWQSPFNSTTLIRQELLDVVLGKEKK
jgi:hypothetical protein